MSSGRVEWLADDEVRVDGTTFVLRPVRALVESTAERLCLRKPRRAVERYLALLDRLQPRRVVEVGMFDGGSAAFLAAVAQPERLVGVDLRAEPSAALDGFVRARGWSDRVVPHWGVDQADQARLRAIADAEFGAAELDLVIDDASHLLGPTRATFDVLFPRLRAGGAYVIEDWSWAHGVTRNWPDETPMTLLVFELVLACAHVPDAIPSVEVEKGWVLVTRGPGALPREGFAISACYGDRGEALLPPGTRTAAAPTADQLRAAAARPDPR